MVERWKCVGYCRHCSANEDDSTFSKEWGHFEKSSDGAWVRAHAAAAIEAENARLNMEMVAYRAKLTPKDVEAMTAVIAALTAEKAARSAPETACEQETPRPCGAASASLPGIAGTPNVCPRCSGKGGKSELKDGRTIYFCACDPCEYHDHRRLNQPCTCVKSTKDPNPLDPINADFRKCLKGHGHYDAWFPWCPKCPEFAEMTQSKTKGDAT